MRFRVAFWLALLPLLAASAVTRAEWQPPSHGSAASVSATRIPDADDALRSSPHIAAQIVSRSTVPHGVGGTAGLRSGPPVQCVAARELDCALIRLATRRVSFATAAHGGPLIYYPTAPPLHG